MSSTDQLGGALRSCTGRDEDVSDVCGVDEFSMGRYQRSKAKGCQERLDYTDWGRNSGPCSWTYCQLQ